MKLAMKIINLKIFQDKITEYLEDNHIKIANEKDPYQKLVYGELIKVLNKVYLDYDIIMIKERDNLLEKTMNSSDGIIHLINIGTFYEYLKNKINKYLDKSKIEKNPYQKWSYDEVVKLLNVLISDYDNLILHQ